MNNWVGVGRITRDLELKYLQSGTAVTKFTLAIDRPTKDKATDFISITVFGKQAENCSNYLTKGSLCAVSGRIQTGSYEAKDGTRRYTTDVVAERVQFLDSKLNGSQNNGVGDIDGFYPVDNGDIPF
mgnify:FL=1